MVHFKLRQFKSDAAPRWPGLPPQEAIALLGYCYGKREIVRDRFQDVREPFDAYRDMMLAAFCCGRPSTELIEATADYCELLLDDGLVRQYLPRRHLFALDLQTAILVSLHLRDGFDVLQGLVRVADDVLGGKFPESQLEGVERTRLEVIVRLLKQQAFSSNESEPDDQIVSREIDIPAWLKAIVARDWLAFQQDVAHQLQPVLTDCAYQLSQSEPLFFGRINAFRRFGWGFVFTGTIALAKLAGFDCRPLCQRGHVKPFILEDSVFLN